MEWVLVYYEYWIYFGKDGDRLVILLAGGANKAPECGYFGCKMALARLLSAGNGKG